MTENGISKYVEHFLKDGHIAAISRQFHVRHMVATRLIPHWNQCLIVTKAFWMHP